jgi:hypothetical protein
MDENQLDTELIRLFEIICQSPANSPEKAKALNRFIILCQKNLSLTKDKHPDYPEALNKTWKWVSENLNNFQLNSSLFTHSLQRWINGYLYWRIKDLYIVNSPPSVSIEQLVSYGEEFSETGFVAPPLSELDALEKSEEEKQLNLVLEEIRRHVEADPDCILRNFHPRGHPECNCQLLIKRLIFQNPPDTLANIAKELGINYQNVNTRWQHTKRQNCRQMLKEIAHKIAKRHGFQLGENT